MNKKVEHLQSQHSNKEQFYDLERIQEFMESVLRTCTCTRTPLVEVWYVWASNLDKEFCIISKAIEGKYHRVTFDIEFKLASNKKHGINNTHPRFASPKGPNKRYCAIKASIDKGSIRQLGLTISADDDSMLVWEFNFELFHRTKKKKKKKRNAHINSYIFFSDIFLSSSLLNNPMITWIMFHSAYDVAFFIKLATSWSPLPNTLVGFEFLVKKYLGANIFNVKYMIKLTNNLYGGLKEVSTALCVERVMGWAHQARSDSLLTWHTYQKLKKVNFSHNNSIRHASVIYVIHDI